MTRLVGAVLLATAAAGLGIGGALRLRSRTEDLRGLLSGLSAMERALTDRMAPLTEMLKEAVQATDRRSQSFFRFCEQRIGRLDGRPFRLLWEASLEGTPLTLEAADRRVLAELGPVLGRYDADNQSRALRQAVRRLEDQLEEAAEQQKRLSKVYGALGISAGLLLVIMML